jgi:hypothetical protein
MVDSRPWVHVLLRSIEDRVALARLGTGLADLCECGFPLSWTGCRERDAGDGTGDM